MTPRGVASTVLCISLSFGSMACTEKPQTSSPRKSDTRAHDGPASAYSAQGWKAGDETSWEAQIRNRANGQNEYSRITVK